MQLIGFLLICLGILKILVLSGYKYVFSDEPIEYFKELLFVILLDSCAEIAGGLYLVLHT